MDTLLYNLYKINMDDKDEDNDELDDEDEDEDEEILLMKIQFVKTIDRLLCRNKYNKFVKQIIK